MAPATPVPFARPPAAPTAPNGASQIAQVSVEVRIALIGRFFSLSCLSMDSPDSCAGLPQETSIERPASADKTLQAACAWNAWRSWKL